MQLEWLEIMRPDNVTTGGETAGSAMFTRQCQGRAGYLLLPESDCIAAPSRFSDGSG